MRLCTGLITDYFMDKLGRTGKSAALGYVTGYVETTGSTNDDLMKAAGDAGRRCDGEGASCRVGDAGRENDTSTLCDLKNGDVLVAGIQTGGRGRRGRSWVTEPGKALTFSLLLKPTYKADYAPQVTLVMALAVRKAIEDMTGLELRPTIKWPNDIVVSGRKICGILTEMKPSGRISVVIGVGVNVNQVTEDFPEDLRDKATSIEAECESIIGKTQRDREEFTAELLDTILCNFDRYYGIFCGRCEEPGAHNEENYPSLTKLVEEYNAHLAGKDEKVRVLDPKEPFEGKTRGINEKGELMVEADDGSLKAVYAGEVSVRGLYSYV